MSITLGDHLHPQKKIHPILVDGSSVIDIEAQPTTPLVPRRYGQSRSSSKHEPERGGSGAGGKDLFHIQHSMAASPPRVLPARNNNTIFPIIDRPPKKEGRSSGSACCKCLCWTIGILVLLLIIVGATIGILYLVFQPKLPNYSVDRLRVSDLRINLDTTLYAKFDVKITAINPNKKIGIHYQKGSLISVWYSTTKLCQGTLPRFYQGHQNKTVLEVALTGQSQYGRTLVAGLQEQQQTGRIPLDLKVDVPVRIQLRKLKLMEVRILGKCLLVVDSLSANNMISIKASTCKFGLKL